MKKGRPNKGVEHIESLDLPAAQKKRARLIYETMCGAKSVAAASKELGVSPGRFAQLRTQYLLHGVEGLAPRPVGRPPKPAGEDTVNRMKQETAQLQQKLISSEAMVEVLQDLLAMGGVGGEEEESGKKNARRQKGRRKSTKRGD